MYNETVLRSGASETIRSERKIFYPIFAFFINIEIVIEIIRLLEKQFFSAETLVFYTRVRMVLYICLAAYIIFYILRNEIKLDIIFITLAFVILIGISLIVEPKVKLVLQDYILNLFSRILPAYFFARYVTDYSELLRCLKPYIYISLIYVCIAAWVGLEPLEYMGFSYNILIPTCVALSYALLKKEYINWLWAIILMISILLMGARAAFLCSVIYIAAILVMKFKEMGLFKTIVVLAVIAFGVFILLYYMDRILYALYSAMPSSRTLKLLYYDDLLDLSGRNVYYDKAFFAIAEDPLKFRGLLGDRFLMTTSTDPNVIFGSYAHNMELEFTIQFGVIPAIVVFFVLFYCLILSVKKATILQSKDFNIIYCMFWVTTLVRLQISGSYLTTSNLWIAIGLMVSVLHLQKNKNRKWIRHEAKVIK
ncbi:O-antigen ligase family protein [Christensenella intestinihominis]|uniref:O-antigen ligase family protein n=1 Tax=Christensenella intestinihominis TaxID=1851429 RepID=UPI000833A7E5|nr:hypothetical protein [Christensenella intestinihominis]